MSTLEKSFKQAAAGIRAAGALSLVTALASACSALPARRGHVFATDAPAAWATRIRSLPVQVQGALPGESSSQTAAAIRHGVAERAGAEFADTGLTLYATPRVVVYFGGDLIPVRDGYCALQPHLVPAMLSPKNDLVVRSALCDGPRPVAYARTTLAQSDPSPTAVTEAVARLKSELLASLLPPEPKPAEFGN